MDTPSNTVDPRAMCGVSAGRVSEGFWDVGQHTHATISFSGTFGTSPWQLYNNDTLTTIRCSCGSGKRQPEATITASRSP
jgi:hypothetical protein